MIEAPEKKRKSRTAAAPVGESARPPRSARDRGGDSESEIDELSGFHERLREVRKLLGYKRAEVFAERIGIPPGTYVGWEQGRFVPKVIAIKRLSDLGVNAMWLLTGSGKPLHQLQDQSSVTEDPASGSGTFLSHMVGVPVYDAKFSAGPGSLSVDEPAAEQIWLAAAWLREHFGASAGVFGVKVDGDSMEPSLFDGDVALLVPASKVGRDGVYGYANDDTLFVKRLQLHPGGRLVVKSDNPAYDPVIVAGPDLERVRVIGRVVGAIKRT